MLQLLQIALYALFFATLAASVYYSFKHRKQTDKQLRGVYAARMNISMGIMLVSLAVNQLFLFPGSWVRITFGTLFLLLGLFNLFAGLKNHAVYSNYK